MTDRLNPERTARDFVRIVALLIEVRDLWYDAVDGGAWAPRSGFNGPGSGLVYSRPTEAAVSSPTRRQLRSKARRAAVLVADARADLEEAAAILSRGILETDPEEWITAVEKRAAATQ